MLMEEHLSSCDVEVDREEKSTVLASHILYQLKLGISRHSSLADQSVLGPSTAQEMVFLVVQLHLLL